MSSAAPPHPAPVTVASIPSGHVYVRHLSPLHGGGPRRLPDPHPTQPDRDATGVWWPPVMLEPWWVREHAADLDLVHLHFGFDARTPDELADWVETLHRHDLPLVYTVHDLRNPHHDTRTLHDQQLDVLVPAAARLVTLTPGAAAEIERRWGREAVVVPHPHVVDLPTLARAEAARARRRTDRWVVGLHLKSLRANLDPLALLPTLIDTVAGLPGAVLQVNAHRDVLDAAPGHDELTDVVRRAAGRGLLELRVHDYLSDADLFAYLDGLDASVLPYRFGTHSGWLEACRDLGTTVIAPSCGFYAEQGPVLTYGHDESGLDPASLAAAVREAHDRRPRLGASLDERRRQRVAVAAAHDDVYAAALREGARCASA